MVGREWASGGLHPRPPPPRGEGDWPPPPAPPPLGEGGLALTLGPHPRWGRGCERKSAVAPDGCPAPQSVKYSGIGDILIRLLMR